MKITRDGKIIVNDLKGTGTSNVCVTAEGELYRC